MARTELVPLDESRSLVVHGLSVRKSMEFDELWEKATEALRGDAASSKDGWKLALEAISIGIRSLQGINSQAMIEELTPGEVFLVAKTILRLSNVQETDRKNSTSSSPT